MAWPLTPLTTYLAGSLPAVKAADMNAIQNAINRALLGTYSYAGLVLDGNGGANAAPPAGGLSASGPGSFGGALSGQFILPEASGGGTSAPTPSVAKNALYSDNCVLAFALIDQAAAGNLLYGFNIQSVVYANANNAAQAWVVQLRAPGNPATMLACAFGTSNGPTLANGTVLSPSGVIQIQTFLGNQTAASQRPCGVIVSGT